MGTLYRLGFRTALSYNHHQTCLFMCVVGAHLCNSTFLIPFERNANAEMRQKTEKTPMEGLEMQRIYHRTWFQFFAVYLSVSSRRCFPCFLYSAALVSIFPRDITDITHLR